MDLANFQAIVSAPIYAPDSIVGSIFAANHNQSQASY